MNPGFVAVLQKLAAEQGKGVLLDPGKCRAFLADYTGTEYKKERRLVLFALEAGVQKAIDASQELELCKKQQARRLQEEYFLAEDAAVTLVDTLALVLREREETQTRKNVCVNCDKELQKEWQSCPYCRPPVKTTPMLKQVVIMGIGVAALVVIIIVLFNILPIETERIDREESVRRLRYRIEAYQRYADVLINDGDFMEAERQLLRGIYLYDYGIRRWSLTPSSMYGRLFAGLGDLEYFVKIGDMEAALNFYRTAERHGWAPPEMLFRMGVAYYNLENWGNALEYFFVASSELPLNHRVLFALGNSALKRGDFFAAQGFYSRLLNVLEGQRTRLPILLPNDRPEYIELVERLMMARNNAGVASEMLFVQTGDLSHRRRAMALYSEAQRAWDARPRDPATMIRSGSVPLPHLNMRNALYPQPGFEPQIFIRIDMDALETSPWERLAPQMMW